MHTYRAVVIDWLCSGLATLCLQHHAGDQATRARTCLCAPLPPAHALSSSLLCTSPPDLLACSPMPATPDPERSEDVRTLRKRPHSNRARFAWSARRFLIFALGPQRHPCGLLDPFETLQLAQMHDFQLGPPGNSPEPNWDLLEPLDLDRVLQQLGELLIDRILAQHDNAISNAIDSLAKTVKAGLRYTGVWRSLQTLDVQSWPLETFQWSVFHVVVDFRKALVGQERVTRADVVRTLFSVPARATRTRLRLDSLARRTPSTRGFRVSSCVLYFSRAVRS